jgi:hypothetical protein
MKKLFFSLFVLVCGLSVFGQNSNIPQPNVYDEPAIYNETSQSLVYLSVESIAPVMRPGKSANEIAGIASNVKINKSDKFSFVIKSINANPLFGLSLYRLTVTRKSREYEKPGLHAFSPSPTSPDDIQISVTSLGNQLYQININGVMNPGEYTFVRGFKAYTFSIY